MRPFTVFRTQIILAGTLLAAVLLPTAAQAWKYKVIHSFCQKPGCVDGFLPAAHLLLDGAGHIFGTSSGGGKEGGGAIFELSRDGENWTYRTLYRVRGFDLTITPLIIDTSGNLYGTTFQGGKYFSGSAYEVVRPQDGGRWKQKTLYSFCPTSPCADGQYPEDGLAYAGQATGALYDGVSPLYGGTQAGGSMQDSGAGVIYQLSHKPGSAHWHQQVIHVFCQPDCTHGRSVSRGELTFDQSGNIFGAARLGGVNDHGTIFELSPDGQGAWLETTLYRFCAMAPCTDGADPAGGLLIDGSGNLLGAALEGGNACADDPDGCGLIFKLTPNGVQSTYSVLYTFCSVSDCQDGGHPGEGLVLNGQFGHPDWHDIRRRGKGYPRRRLRRRHGLPARQKRKGSHSFCQKADCMRTHTFERGRQGCRRQLLRRHL